MAGVSNPYAGDISVEAAMKLLSGDGRATLVDVRTEPEWQFVGAPDLSGLGKDVIFLSWQTYPSMQVQGDFASSLAGILKERGAEPNAPILFLCRSGARSRSAAMEMTKAGWDQCYNVADGFEGPLDAEGRRGRSGGWKSKGLPWRQS
jgi:rhodanese-related sulfurtransferase